MNLAPMISVVMPVYNGEKYIKEAIDSILNQTFSDFEFIILNDGSTDKTEEIILSYNDPRIVSVKNNENLQIVKTLNKGIKLAKGKYIARMDADDISLPNRFEKQLAFMESHSDVSICGCWLDIFGARKEKWKYPIHHEEIKAQLLFNSALAHPSVFMRKNTFNTKSYNEYYNKAEDYNLWVEAILDNKFHNIPEYLLKYRLHTQQTEKIEQVLLSNQIREKLLNRIGCYLSNDMKKIFFKVISNNSVAIDDIEILFKLLIFANEKSNYLNQKIFQRLLGEKFWKNIKQNSKYNLNTFNRYHSSFLSKYYSLSLFENFKFYVKSLIA